MDAKQAIIENKTALGIELGSTRIKAVLIDGNYSPVASGNHDWENRLIVSATSADFHRQFIAHAGYT
ncbi:MAG: hypothetical protein FWD13_06760 [Treponema sp.]|nr:hypothetical protein [Treponema sp.]